MSTVIRTTGCILAAVAMLGCQGESSPMGPAPKTAAVQADTTSGCVIINVTGDNVTVSGAETANIDLPDTVYVDSTTATGGLSGGPSGDAFTWMQMRIDYPNMEWIASRGGWAYYDSTITNASISAVYLRKEVGFVSAYDVEPVEWTEFYQFLEDEGITGDHAPTYSILDALNEFFISDQDQELASRYSPQSVRYILGILLSR